MFDYDGKFQKSDVLGSATLPLEAFLTGAPTDTELALDLQGSITVNVSWVNETVAPLASKSKSIMGRSASKSKGALVAEGEALSSNRMPLTSSATSRVTELEGHEPGQPIDLVVLLRRGSGLLAADKNGK